jgi:hypothetical protein
VQPLPQIDEVRLIAEVQPLPQIDEVLTMPLIPLPDSIQPEEEAYVEDFMADDSYSPSKFARRFSTRHEENLKFAQTVFGLADDTSDISSLGGLEFGSERRQKIIGGVLVNEEMSLQDTNSPKIEFRSVIRQKNIGGVSLKEEMSLQDNNSPKYISEKNLTKFPRTKSEIILTPEALVDDSYDRSLSPATDFPKDNTPATNLSGTTDWHAKYTQNIPVKNKSRFCGLS